MSREWLAAKGLFACKIALFHASCIVRHTVMLNEPERLVVSYGRFSVAILRFSPSSLTFSAELL